MPQAEIEIMRTRTVTVEENCTVTVNVPKGVLDDADELYAWVENKIGSDPEFAALVTKEMAAESEDEEVEIHEVNHIA